MLQNAYRCIYLVIYDVRHYIVCVSDQLFFFDYVILL